MNTKELAKFIGNEEGDLFCAICNRKGEWDDCDYIGHEAECYRICCFKCGVEDRDCEAK